MKINNIKYSLNSKTVSSFGGKFTHCIIIFSNITVQNGVLNTCLSKSKSTRGCSRDEHGRGSRALISSHNEARFTRPFRRGMIVALGGRECVRKECVLYSGGLISLLGATPTMLCREKGGMYVMGARGISYPSQIVPGAESLSYMSSKYFGVRAGNNRDGSM